MPPLDYSQKHKLFREGTHSSRKEFSQVADRNLGDSLLVSNEQGDGRELIRVFFMRWGRWRMSGPDRAACFML
jgi:hypothetical protein